MSSIPTFALLLGTPIAVFGAFAALFWGFWFGIAASIREIEETEERDRERIRERRMRR